MNAKKNNPYVYSVMLYIMHTLSMRVIPTAQIPLLIPQRLDIINLLHSLRSQHKRMLLLHTDAIFDTDAHAAEVSGVSVRIRNVKTTSTKITISEKCKRVAGVNGG